MLPALQLCGLLALSSVALYYLFFRSKKSVISELPGPTASSWILGNQAEFLHSEAGAANKRWCQEYGDVYRFQQCFGTERLVLNDPKAISHVLGGQTTTFHVDESLREFVRLVGGKGLAYVDGPIHTRDRRIVQPSFNTPFIKSLVPQFVDCTHRVSKQWELLLDRSKDGTVDLNVYDWAGRVSKESIGQTAFGVRFGAIEGEHHQLAEAYSGLISMAYAPPSKLLIALQGLVLQLPTRLIAYTDYLPSKRIRALNHAKASSLAFSRKIIQEERARLELDKIREDRNILTTLVRAGENDAMGKFKGMTDGEIYEHLTTFFVAGFESTCTTLTFALYELARNVKLQDKLFAQVCEVLGPYATYETFEHTSLEQMPYLQAVIKETLRLHTAIAYGLFEVGTDNVIPLTHSIKTLSGEMLDSIPVKKGERILTPFDGFNRLPEVWGSDAEEFKPERWITGRPDEVPSEKRCGGPYANLANFGGGPKTCPGWRFAVLELESFLAVLIHRFSFALADPAFQLKVDGCHVFATPSTLGQDKRGPWMPLKIQHRKKATTTKA